MLYSTAHDIFIYEYIYYRICNESHNTQVQAHTLREVDMMMMDMRALCLYPDVIMNILAHLGFIDNPLRECSKFFNNAYTCIVTSEPKPFIDTLIASTHRRTDKYDFDKLLLICASRGWISRAKLLTRHRSFVNLSSFGYASLLIACLRGHEGIARDLICKSVIEIMSPFDSTSLDDDYIRTFMTHRAAINAALCMAAFMGHVNVVEVLLVYGEVEACGWKCLSVVASCVEALSDLPVSFVYISDVSEIIKELQDFMNSLKKILLHDDTFDTDDIDVDDAEDMNGADNPILQGIREHISRTALPNNIEEATHNIVSAIDNAMPNANMTETRSTLETLFKETTSMIGDKYAFYVYEPLHGTPLLLASSMGHTSVVHLLLSEDSPVDMAECLALRLACLAGHDNVVSLLIPSSDIHARQDEPLILAVEYNHPTVVALLIAAGADVRARDAEALVIASNRGHTSIINLLLAKVDSQFSPDQLTEALHQCVIHEHTEGVHLLLEAGAE